MSYRKNYTKDGQRPVGWNTGDKVEVQDVLSVTLKEKMILLAALQYYRTHHAVRGDGDVLALCKRLERVTGFDYALE